MSITIRMWLFLFKQWEWLLLGCSVYLFDRNYSNGCSWLSVRIISWRYAIYFYTYSMKTQNSRAAHKLIQICMYIQYINKQNIENTKKNYYYNHFGITYIVLMYYRCDEWRSFSLCNDHCFINTAMVLGYRHTIMFV